MSAARRRALLGSLAAVVAAPDAMAKLAQLAPVSDSPDAELLGACAEFDAMERSIQATYDEGPDNIPDDAAREVHNEQLKEPQEALLDRICAMQAVTPAGFAARARTLVLWEGAEAATNTEEGYWNERMLAALLRDLQAVAP